MPAFLEKKRVLNKIGIDKVFMVNSVAPIMMSLLLFNILKNQAPARVINLGSIGEKYASIDFNNLNSEKIYTGNTVYNQSKRSIVMLTYKLSELFSPFGITVNCLSPETFKSDRINEEYRSSFLDNFLEAIFRPITKKSAEMDTTVFLAVDQSVKNITGKYFCDMHLSESSKESHDKIIQERLWEYITSIVYNYLPDSVKNQFYSNAKNRS